MIQFALADGEVPNPTSSAVIRAADARTESRLFRFDLALQAAPAGLPPQPHRFLSNPDIFSSPAQTAIAMAAQNQAAGFLALDGRVIPDANLFLGAPYAGRTLFETPSSLPEQLNFTPLVPPGACP